jgi:hypothetical protein
MYITRVMLRMTRIKPQKYCEIKIYVVIGYEILNGPKEVVYFINLKILG